MFHSRPSVAGEPDRLVCPNGHTRWSTSSGHYWCHDCSQLHDVDPEFDELYDQETGDVVPASGGNPS